MSPAVDREGSKWDRAARLLRVATVHPHVVSGPVSTRLRLIDLARAQQLFNELALTGVGARRIDVSHRWRDARNAS